MLAGDETAHMYHFPPERSHVTFLVFKAKGHLLITSIRIVLRMQRHGEPIKHLALFPKAFDICHIIEKAS